MEQKKYRIEPLWSDKTKGLRSAVVFIDDILVPDFNLVDELSKDPEAFKCIWRLRTTSVCAENIGPQDSLDAVIEKVCRTSPWTSVNISSDLHFYYNNDLYHGGIDVSIRSSWELEECLRFFGESDECSASYRVTAYPVMSDNCLEVRDTIRDIQEKERDGSKTPRPYASVIKDVIVPQFKGRTRQDILKWLHENPDALFKPRPHPMSAEQRYEWDHGVVLKINRPEIRRETGNTNKNTFDFVRVEMSIRSTYQSVEKLKKCKKDLIQKALDKIDGYKPYQKYGVPVKYLHLYRMTLLQCGDLILDFEVPKAIDILKGEGLSRSYFQLKKIRA